MDLLHPLQCTAVNQRNGHLENSIFAHFEMTFLTTLKLGFWILQTWYFKLEFFSKFKLGKKIKLNISKWQMSIIPIIPLQIDRWFVLVLQCSQICISFQNDVRTSQLYREEMIYLVLFISIDLCGSKSSPTNSLLNHGKCIGIGQWKQFCEPFWADICQNRPRNAFLLW